MTPADAATLSREQLLYSERRAESIHTGYLHELAEARRHPAQDRRRESWAEVRAEIDAMLTLLKPVNEREYRIILRAYGIGMGRAAKMMPRQQTTLTEQEVIFHD